MGKWTIQPASKFNMGDVGFYLCDDDENVTFFHDLMSANGALVTIQNDFLPRLESQQARIAELEHESATLQRKVETWQEAERVTGDIGEEQCAILDKELQSVKAHRDRMLGALTQIFDLAKHIKRTEMHGYNNDILEIAENMLTDGSDESTAPDCDTLQRDIDDILTTINTILDRPLMHKSGMENVLRNILSVHRHASVTDDDTQEMTVIEDVQPLDRLIECPDCNRMGHWVENLRLIVCATCDGCGFVDAPTAESEDTEQEF